MIARRFRHVLRNVRGATAIEFGIVAPVMVMLFMGLGDTLYQAYVQAMLSGAVQKAGRDSAIEGGAQQGGTIDQKVQTLMQTIAKNATFSSTRKNYDTFASANPEPFVDGNANGIRDPGECFTDINANGSWDADPGINGQGGANDVTLYTMTMTYPRLFPFAKLLGWGSMQTVTAQTFLKNQPYAQQGTLTPTTVCT